MTERRTGVVSVFRNEHQAQAAAEAARRAGADPNVIRIGAARDHVASVQAEMADELDQSFMGPGNIGPFTKEMSKAIVPATIAGAVIGGLISLPFSAIHFGSLGVVARLVIVVIVGVAVGATIGFQLGGMRGATKEKQSLASEDGVTVAIDDAPPGAIDAIRAMRPLRLDTIEEHGRRTGTLETEEDR